MLDLVCVLVVDAMQVVYRLMMCALVSCFAGIPQAVALMLVYSFVSFFLLHVGLSAPPYIKTMWLGYGQTFFIAVVVCVHDAMWFEAPASGIFYFRYAFMLRAMQMLCAVWLISANWGKQEAWNPIYFWVAFSVFIVTAAIYLSVYSFYCWGLRCKEFKDRRDEALELYADWIMARKAQRLPKESGDSVDPKPASNFVSL